VSDPELQWWDEAPLNRERWRDVVQPVLDRIVLARDSDRMPHALLLVGPPGLGRETAAVEAAVMLVCEGQPAPWSDSPCADRVRRGVHPDVVAMMPEGKAGIIKIKPLREQVVDVVGSRPYEGLRRVWIFDGVEEEHFPRASANALLKTLEEPPEHAMFILLAANPTAVLPTIRSRCQQLALPGVVALAQHLMPDVEVPELAASPLEASDVNTAIGEIRKALATGLSGETGPLVRLPYRIPDGLPPFAAVASVALEMACDAEDLTRGEDMVRLATELLATERRAGALNLNQRGQLASCILRWYRELQ
jgi:DNA polymerase-3 subunit delta'